MDVVVAALGTAAALAATIVLARSWRVGGRPDAAQLFLAVAVGMWTLGSLGLTFSLVGGWTGPAVRIWTLLVLVLAPGLCMVAAVARHGVDALSIRVTGLVLVALVAWRLGAALDGNRVAATTAILAGVCAVLCLDGNRQRVVLGTGATIVVFAAVAIVTVLPSPIVAALPDVGVPVPGQVLPRHVVAFEVAARHVALVVVCVTAVVGALRGLAAHRRSGGVVAAWRAWGRDDTRGPALAALLVPIGLIVVERTTRGGDGAMVAMGAAAGLAVGTQLVQRGARGSRSLRAPGRHSVASGTTTVWE